MPDRPEGCLSAAFLLSVYWKCFVSGLTRPGDPQRSVERSKQSVLRVRVSCRNISDRREVSRTGHARSFAASGYNVFRPGGEFAVMKSRSILLTALATIFLMSVATAAQPDVEDSDESAILRLVEDDSEALFLRCCWAKGRAGFHFCEQYGICESDPEATCKGVGAAEGRTLSCKAGPPASLSEAGG